MEEIKSQLVFLLGSFLSGVAVMFAYEAVNVFRGLVRPGIVGKLAADLLFFAVSAVLVFQMIFLCNNGTIRSFFLLAFGTGAVLYRRTFGTVVSRLIVKGARKLIHVISRPFVWCCGKLLKKMKKSEKKP